VAENQEFSKHCCVDLLNINISKVTRCPLRISCPVTPVERDVVDKRVDLGSVDVLERSDLQDRNLSSSRSSANVTVQV
jgi:hypothetical protein